MSVETVVLNGLGLIPAEMVSEICAGIEDGVILFRRYAEVENIGISVHDSGFVGDETGFGGISYGSQSFALYVDPDCEAARLNTRLHAAATTVHELHHCLRQRACPLRPYSQMCAGDVLVLEGLAVHCEEFLGYGQAPAVQGVGIDGIRPLIERIAPIIGDHQADWGWIYERNGLKHGALYGMAITSSRLTFQRTEPTPLRLWMRRGERSGTRFKRASPGGRILRPRPTRQTAATSSAKLNGVLSL
jgi:hypothetical protein